jgi:hypothetical protein
MKYVSVLALLSLLLLASCANRGQTGAVGGAAAGALIGQAIGHNTEGTLIGAAVGTMLGYIVGSEMDKYDRQQLDHMYERGVSNQRSTWVNPDTPARLPGTLEPPGVQTGGNRGDHRRSAGANLQHRLPQRIRPVGIAAALIRSISGDHAGR